MEIKLDDTRSFYFILFCYKCDKNKNCFSFFSRWQFYCTEIDFGNKNSSYE